MAACVNVFDKLSRVGVRSVAGWLAASGPSCHKRKIDDSGKNGDGG